jgi:hypothetical protein
MALFADGHWTDVIADAAIATVGSAVEEETKHGVALNAADHVAVDAAESCSTWHANLSIFNNIHKSTFEAKAQSVNELE